MRRELAWQKFSHMAVEILVTDFGEYPCPPELSTRPGSGVKLRNNYTPDRRTTKGKEWFRKFTAFCEQKRTEYMAVKT